MRLVCISDTHSLHENVILPEGDILVCAGDITNDGSILDLHSFLNWMKNLYVDTYKKIIVIAGNHDLCFEQQPSLSRNLVKDSGLVYLQDEFIDIEGLKIFGSPNTPFFCNWAFNKQRGKELRKIWKQIPNETNILITHGPAYGILDTITPTSENLGCEELYKRIQKLPNLKISICGHIHGGYGMTKINNITYINASICTERYEPINLPIVIDI